MHALTSADTGVAPAHPRADLRCGPRSAFQHTTTVWAPHRSGRPKRVKVTLRPASRRWLSSAFHELG
jgi:hypothetical protein